MNEIERLILEKLLAGAHPCLAALRTQMAEIEVIKREWTGVGFMTDFAVPPTVMPAPCRRPVATIGDVFIESSELSHDAGVVLFIKDGYLDFLEAFTFDEPWPDHMSDLHVGYPSEGPRDLSCLGP